MYLANLKKKHNEICGNVAKLGEAIQRLEDLKIGLMWDNIKEIERTGSLKDIENFIVFFEKEIIFHFNVEEEPFLFYLEKEECVDKKLISEIRQEHVNLIEMFNKLKQNVSLLKTIEQIRRKEAFKLGFKEDISETIKLLKDLTANLSKHAKKEDEQLLPLAKHLTEEQLKSIEQVSERSTGENQ